MLLFLNYIDNKYYLARVYKGRLKIKNTTDVQLYEKHKNKYNFLNKSV